jgi:ComF family protein
MFRTRWTQPIRRAVTPFLDFIYPPHCLGCEEVIDARDVLCARCMADLIRIPFSADASRRNLESLTYPFAATLMHVGFDYERESALESCVHAMKYRGLHRIAEWFGALLGEGCAGTPLLRGRPLLAPIPLHRVKRIERGFNQAEYICKGMARETGLPFVPDLLRRTRYTASQAMSRLDVAGRRHNMLNAFVLNPARAADVAGRPVILVDDLITTGATMAECALVLQEHGVSDIRIAAIARPMSAA